MNVTEAPIKIVWNDELRKLYSRFPSILRSKRWPEIQKLALLGDVDGAEKIALDLENRSVAARIENASANKLRIQRVALFSRIARAERFLRVLFDRLGTSLARKVEKRATSPAKVAGLNKDIDATTTEMRVEMRKWLRSLTRDSTLMALKNAGDAFKSSFDASKKASEIFTIERIILVEAIGKIPLKGLKGRTPKVKIFSQKWRGITKRIVKTILKSNILGTPANQRIVELTQRANNEMKRILANDIAQGKGPAVIARKIKKFISPQITTAITRGEILPRGVYRSIFKNAMRLARTEANKAYTHASAEWAEDKPFITGIKVTLSPVHSKTDICDTLAARGEMSPEEFKSVIPAHPHCMCYPTYVYQDRFLDKEAD